MPHRFRTAPSHEGPRDVFMHRPIREAVVEVLVGLNFNLKEIFQLLGLLGAEEVAVAESYHFLVQGADERLRQPERRAVLKRWIALHELEQRFGGKHYYVVKTSDCAYFVHDLGQNQEPGRDTTVRIMWELYEALGIWLELDDFLTVAGAAGEYWRHLLMPGRRADGVNDGFSRGGHHLHEAFAEELGLLDWRAPKRLYLEILKDGARDPGEIELRKLVQLYEERFRPFIMPIWPEGSAERISSLLLPAAAQLSDRARAEIEYRCTPRDYSRVPSGLAPQAAEALRLISRLMPAERQQVDSEIAAWLRANGRELIDLVTPVGR